MRISYKTISKNDLQWIINDHDLIKLPSKNSIYNTDDYQIHVYDVNHGRDDTKYYKWPKPSNKIKRIYIANSSRPFIRAKFFHSDLACEIWRMKRETKRSIILSERYRRYDNDEFSIFREKAFMNNYEIDKFWDTGFIQKRIDILRSILSELKKETEDINISF